MNVMSPRRSKAILFLALLIGILAVLAPRVDAEEVVCEGDLPCTHQRGDLREESPDSTNAKEEEDEEEDYSDEEDDEEDEEDDEEDEEEDDEEEDEEDDEEEYEEDDDFNYSQARLVSVPWGVPQRVETSQILEATRSYMMEEVSKPEFDEVRDSCWLYHESCSFWAGTGQCRSNPSYMVLQCAPACRTCHVIGTDPADIAEDVSPVEATEGIRVEETWRAMQSLEFSLIKPQAARKVDLRRLTARRSDKDKKPWSRRQRERSA
jgi:hypothetical protein